MKSEPYDPNNPDQTGCIIGMPNQVYHEHPAVSHSKLWLFHQRPKKYEGKYITGEIQEETTDALVAGSGGHSILLEPWDDFQKNYACLRKPMHWRSKADKLDNVKRMADAKGWNGTAEEMEDLAAKTRPEIEQFFHNLPGRTILRPDIMDQIRIIRDKVRSHPEAKILLGEGIGEVTFRSPKIKLGFQVQCRFDWLNTNGCVFSEGRPYGFDLKTVSSLERWNREFLHRGYYRAWPWYSKVQQISVGGEIIQDWFWIVAEKEWPYSVMVKRPDEAWWDRGMREVTKDMERLSEALKNDHFPDPGDGGITIQGIPDYMITENVPEPGIYTGPEYTPRRDYEYEEGWIPEETATDK